MGRYKVIYKQFSPFHTNNYNGMALFKEVIETDDIYHWIGKKVCNSIEKFEFCSYLETKEELTSGRTFIGKDFE